MSECKGCDEKKATLAAEEAAYQAKKAAEVPQPVTNALYITCTCGLARLLPSGRYEIGDAVELTPCPRCGSYFKGTFVGDRIECDN